VVECAAGETSICRNRGWQIITRSKKVEESCGELDESSRGFVMAVPDVVDCPCRLEIKLVLAAANDS